MSTLPNAGPEDCYVLTPVQQKVVALLSAGSTITAAARSAGIHRNTLTNWRRRPAVQAALSQATQANANLWRGQTDALTLLKAAVAILERQGRSPDVVHPVHNPAQPDPPAAKITGTNPIHPIDRGPNTLVTSSPLLCETVQPMHTCPCSRDTAQAPKTERTNPIQPIDRGPKTLVTSSRPCETVQPMHNTAQAPKTERTNPISASAGRLKAGRNHPCPCGSGKKFKRCCLSTGVS